MKYDSFIFKNYTYNTHTHTLSMHYEYAQGPKFEEIVIFPPSTKALSAHDKIALDRLFQLIFLLSGISYYKAYVPPELRCEAFPLDKEMGSFLEKVYLNGLGEFAYRNNLNLSHHLHFITEEKAPPTALFLDLEDTILVPVGGGKDSIVTIEALKEAKESLTLFAVGTKDGVATPILDTIKVSGLPCLLVQRIISKNLIALNNQDALNGHVPVTAILSSIALATALLNKSRAVILSNEYSADSPNLIIGDLAINHQYSKSLAFEKDLAHFVHKNISPDLVYFSFLRPLTEVAITRRFAHLEKYHSIFRSCNTAFRQNKEQRNKNWCCDCPKCRFVFLALAPFIEKQKLIAIFGHNMLADETQREGYKELCGLSAHKPFECVGEIEESVLLIQKLYQNPDWKNDILINQLGALLPCDNATFTEKFTLLFQNHPTHRLPQKYRNILDASEKL